MDNNQNPFAFLNNTAGLTQPTKTTGGNEFTFLQAREKPLSLNADLGSLAKEEGAEHLMPVINAIYGQESGAGSNSKTSTDGARGGMQVMPDTFRRFAKQGESIDNPADNMRVGMRVIKSLGDKFGNDPAKIATGYFSGEGNVNAGDGSAWKNDHKDGNGKRVSGYVSDVLGRLSPISEAKADENLPDLSQIPKWSEISTSQKYLSLPDVEKSKLKGAYFDDVLAPHAGSDSVKAREQFMAQRDTASGFDEKLGQKMAGVVPAVRDILGIDGKPKTGSVMDGYTPKDQAAALTHDGLPARQNPDGSYSTEISITVKDPRLNGGKPTNIPSLWGGKEVDEETAVANALSSGKQYQGFDSIEQAVSAAKAKSQAGGANAPAVRYGDTLGTSQTLRNVDTSVENRRARLVGQGEDPRFAQRAAEEAAAAGIAPGAEIAFMQKQHGTVGNSGFDFETSEAFNKQSGINNPLVRGAAKAGLGTTKALSGYTQFAGEVLGIEGMQDSGKNVGAWARGKEQAIGEKGTFLERNLEGAINSIGQQLPLMIAGVKLESEALPLAGMAMQTFGKEYSDGRSVGQTPVEAAQRAAIFSAFEVIGEKFGLGDSMKAIKAAARGMPNDQIVGFLWSALKKEVPGELLTTTGQFGTDKLPTIGLNQNATGEDYLKQVGDTIAQTIMQSGVMAGGTTGVSTAVRYLRDKSGNATVDAIHADDTRQRVLDRWNQGPLGVPRDQITPDGRIETVTPPNQPAPDVAAAPPSPIDVHPTSAVADGIVADLATQAGVPHEFVLPAQKPADIPNGDGIADQEALDYAEMRYRQLLAKRDGRVDQVVTDAGLMDQEVPGTPLSGAEAAELAALESANGNPAAIRSIYQAQQAPVTPAAVPAPAKQDQPTDSISPAEQIDVTGRTDQQLQYISTNGQPGWKEAAIAELEKRAAQQPAPQGQFASADEANGYISAQRRASSAKLPKALPMPFGDGTFGVVTEAHEGWAEAQAYQKANAPKTEKEAKARKAKTADNKQTALEAAQREYDAAKAAWATSHVQFNGDRLNTARAALEAAKQESGAAAAPVTVDQKTELKAAPNERLQDAYIAGLSAGQQGSGKKHAPTDLSPEEKAQWNKGIEDAYAVVEREKQNKAAPGFTRKEIPAMSNEELVAAQEYYNNLGHKRATKIAKEINKRAQTIKEQSNGNQTAETVETQAQEPQASDAGAREGVTEDKYAVIDRQFSENREALKSLKVGDDVEFTNPGTYTQKNGTKREGLLVQGKIEKIIDKRQGTVKVGNWSVAARNLTKIEPEQTAKKYENSADKKQMLRDAANWWENATKADRRVLLADKFTKPIVDGNAALEWNEIGDGMQQRIAEIIDAKMAAEQNAAPEQKPMADGSKPAQGPHYAAGRNAALAGKPRELPSYFTSEKGKNPKEWYSGWDSVKAEPASEAGKLEVRLTEAQQNLLDLRKKQSDAVQNGNAWVYDDKIAAAEKTVESFKQALDKKAAPEQKPVAKAVQQQFANNKVFTADKVEAARERLRAKLGQFNSGIDPEVVMDGMTIAGAYIESGVRKFADYAKAMTDDFGDKIKPYLLSFYEAARNYPGIENDGMSSVTEAKAAHDELLMAMPEKAVEELKVAMGTNVKAPAKRTKKTGAKTDMTLTQDWGTEHIDGYGTEFNRETGNDTKDAFLKEAKTYLTTIAGILTQQGYLPQKDNRGRDIKPVSVNEGGMAGSGDVYMTMYHPDGHGIYATVGETALRGVVPTTKSGIAIMFRAASENDRTGSKSTNRWAPVDLSAADLSIMFDKESKANVTTANKFENPIAGAILKTEDSTNDAKPNQIDAGSGAVEQQPVAARGSESQEPAGRNAATDSGAGNGVNRGSAERSNRVGDTNESTDIHRESDGARADAEQPVQSGRGRSAGTGNRGSDGARSGVSNYRISAGELQREGSWKTTAQRNVEIVELVKQITAENRQATPEERALLVKFTGWGASEVANGVFPDRYGRYKDASWQALGERLKASLTEEEYAQAKRTTQYAHYTSEPVIRSIYDGLARLGFAGGSVVEPGMGNGHFNGLMPDAMAAKSNYTGIEYDTLTGTIAKLLYPSSNIVVGDFTRTGLPRDFFDVGIGNPPFSSTQILSDPEYKSMRPMLHDYFFMKTIDRVKPGGLLVFVTSKGTMDKSSDKSRKYLAERANLLGAIRLPQTAFKDNAGTEVVTDVIFLQKRGEGIEDNGVQWLGTKEINTKDGAATINEYFADHPEMVLGTHALQGSMYRANEYTVLPLEGDIEQHFAQAIKKLPENIYRPQIGTKAKVAAVQDRDFNPKHKKEGGLYISDSGRLMILESGSGVDVTYRTNSEGKQIALTEKQKTWLKDYVGLRDALKQAQFDQLNDGNWEASLKVLNKAYDGFAKKHGQIMQYTVIERTNKETGETTETKRYKNDPLLRMDAEGALAYALEQEREDGTLVKGAVLTGRVLEKPRDPEIKTTQDALFVSLNQFGYLDVDEVAKLAGTDKASVIRDLGNAIYDAPGAGWALADEYLSGNVVRKLKEARAAADLDTKYKRNVEALLAVQPRPLGPTDITVRLGANWVPASDVAKFAQEVIGDQMEISYNPVLNKWDVDQRGRSVSEWAFDKATSGSILDALLNNRQIKITWRDSEGKTHVDLESTEKANDIAGKMRDRFKSWVWSDPKRSERLVAYYNDNFNNIAPRQFDGSHLTLPGVSSRFKLYPHQKRAVWRIVQQGDTYLAHAVGAGKTMEMIAGGMEERRLGLVKKPMYVVPNHMLAQFSREFLELYPTANIMVADEHNFHSSNRKRFVAQAALNNPDAIVITHSAFGRIGMSDKFYEEFITNQIEEWKDALNDVDKSDRITRKQVERRIEQLEQRLEGRQNKDKKDQVLAFEELGVDRLFVDEFHEFRKLDFATNQGNVSGIDSNGSQRALDLYMKVEYLRSKNPGRSLVAASGTPITNTMGELYTAQRFFQPDQLEEDGTESFDAWSSQYGDIVTGFEQNAAGGYEMKARFAKFQNVPELMRRVRSFMDILTSSNLGELVKRPDVIGGGRQVEITPVPDGYKEYQQQLQARIRAIRNRKGPPKKGQDIILSVIGDGRFSAIDMRFVNHDAPSDPNSKLNTAITRMIEAYNDTKGYEYAGKDGTVEPIKGSSIILFTDIGLGEQSAASRGFDMRGWIEKRLIEAGIPREHIAFMRDHKQHAKKERLFADMREGKKRILIGGKEMETGTNVQKRLSHLFHLDAPWFPASVEQREGRIVRQGNQNKEVKITALATKGSYDSTMWGMNARKARFIEQAMNGDDSVRSLEDVSEASAFEMAAALASGDERYLRLAGLKADVERLERLRQAHYDDQNRLTRDKHWAEENVKRSEGRVKAIKEAIAKRQPIVAGSFTAKLAGKTYDSREDFGQAAFREFQSLAGDSFMGEKQIGEIGGFPIKVFGIKMQGPGGYAAALHVELPDSDPLLTFPLDPDVSVSGIATRAANQVNGLDRLQMEVEAGLKASTAKIEQIEKRLGSVFPEESLLMEKVAELSALEAELAKESAEAEAKSAEQPQEGDAPQTNLSRGKGGKGMALRDLNAIVNRARSSLKNLPQVHVFKDPGSLDLSNPSQKRLHDEIYRRGADGDVEGANHEGDIYLFADNLADEFRAEHVLVNHEVGHYGLREVFGNSGLDPILNTIYMTNAKFRKKVDAYREEFGLESNAEAVEEVLVDTPPEDLIKLNGWRRIVRFMRDWLESHGFAKMSGRLNALLKAGMSEQNKADLLVADVINAAREWVRNGEPSKSGAIQETRLSEKRGQEGRLPDALILADLGALNSNALYESAKNGDAIAAIEVVESILTQDAISKIKDAIGTDSPIVVPVVSKETSGHNQIPMMAAMTIGDKLGLNVSSEIYQSTSPKRTAMDGLGRIFSSPLFDGNVEPGKSYLLVDDTLTQGATFAELSGFINERGGKVIANVALTGKQYSAKLQVTKETLGKLREKFSDIEDQFQAATGHRFDSLTESEARYLSSYKPADAIRDRIVAEGRKSGTAEISGNHGSEVTNSDRAIGDNGGNTRFSRKPYSQVVRDLQGNAVQFFGNQDLKTFNGLNKTINTQFHKALKDKDFGRVYNLIQSMQNHVATASSRPAELAPGVLHRVDNVISAVKTLVSKSQRQAIEKAGEALFAGTLSGNSVMDGRVWSDLELREKFGLDDTGVALYFQARKAIDASLDELAAAEAFAIAQTYLPKALREDIIESPEDAEALIMAALGRQIDMGRRAKLDDDSMASLEDAREKAGAIFEQAKKLKKAGYAPLMRFGKFDLKVMATDPETGNLQRDENDNPVTLYYSRFESQSKLREAERELRARYADKLDEVRILPGVVNDNANELYRGVNPETLSVFAEAVGARQAMDDYIRLVRSERSAMKRRLERKGTPGYSLDVQRVLANFITSNARQSAQQLFGTSVNNAIRRIPREKGDVQKEALALRDYVINPEDNGALGSSLMFAWFLGGSPAAALVNMTQPVMMTLPYLSQYGAARASAALTKAVPYAVGAKQITDADLRAALKKASLEGIVDAQEVFHLYAIGSRQLSAGPRSQAAMTLWGSMFSAVEGLNRRLTFIAAWNMAIAKGDKNPYTFAVNAVNQTQGIYNKANRPNGARSTVGRAIFTFKTYSIMYVELMNRMWKSGPEGKKAVLLMMAVLILASGIEGLPGAKAVDDIIDTIGQWMGYDTNMKRWKRRHAYELLGKVAGDLVLYGASSLTPLDFGGRLGMGNMIPGTDLLKPSSGLGNYARSIGEIVGPTAGAAQQIGDAAEALEEGNYGQAAKNLMPKAGRDFANAIDMGRRGYARDMAGRKTVETTATDAVIKGVGFNPTVVADRTRASMPIQQDVQLAKKKEASIVGAWSQAIMDGDQKAAQEQADRLKAWNRDNPDTPIKITADQIRNRAKLLQTDKNSRITKTAPKEMRGRIGLELLK